MVLLLKFSVVRVDLGIYDSTESIMNINYLDELCRSVRLIEYNYVI